MAKKEGGGGKGGGGGGSRPTGGFWRGEAPAAVFWTGPRSWAVDPRRLDVCACAFIADGRKVLLLVRGSTARCVRLGGTSRGRGRGRAWSFSSFLLLLWFIIPLTPFLASRLGLRVAPQNDESAGVGNERTRGPARPGQARPVEAERSPLWGRGRARPGARRRAGEMETVRNLDTSCCTYMGPAPRASQPRAAARWHGTGKGNHNLEKSLDAGGLAAPQEAHLLVHTWHGGCDPCLMCWLASSPVDKRGPVRVTMDRSALGWRATSS